MADLEIDHILPKVKSGKTVFENLCAVCRKCNERKGPLLEAIDPVSGESSPLFNPRTQIWSDHFEFSDDGVLFWGKPQWAALR
jgi:5-methylcytosine-specific restriction endonuclease McrA